MSPRRDGPLRDVRVVVLSGMGPTPYASMLLADMGAHVLRVSRPAHRQAKALEQNEGLAPEHDVAQRGSQCVTADLKAEDGRDAVLSLIERADVFVEGFRPGVAERLGLGPASLHERNPALVYARLTGYGQTGPLAQEAGHDINYVAQSGVLSALADADGRPRPPLNLLGDYAGGGTFAALGIVSAVLDARSTGQGQVIDAAMLDGVAALSARIQGLRASGIHSDRPGENFLDGGAPFYDTYRCADGKFLAVGALESQFYAAFLHGLEVDTSCWPDQNDAGSWPALRELIATTIGERSRDEWMKRFQGKDSCVSPVLTFEEAAAHPHNAQRRLYAEVGGALHPAPAPRFSRSPQPEPVVPMTAPRSISDVLREWGAPRTNDSIGEES